MPYLYMELSTLNSIIDAGTLPILVNSIKSLVVQYNLDGIDLDIEEGTNQASLEILVNACYNELKPMGKLITADVHATAKYVSLTTAQKLDFINIMAYDMWGYPDQNPPGFPHSSYADTVASMQSWINAGYPKDKLVMGIPFYGFDTYRNMYFYRDLVNQYNPTPDQDLYANGTIWCNGVDTVKEKEELVWKSAGDGETSDKSNDW